MKREIPRPLGHEMVADYSSGHRVSGMGCSIRHGMDADNGLCVCWLAAAEPAGRAPRPRCNVM